MLKGYIRSHVSEPFEELFFFNKPLIDSFRDASEKTKDRVSWSSYIQKNVRAELFTEFKRDACKVGEDDQLVSDVLTTCWWGLLWTEFFNQCIDPAREGHYLDVFETTTSDADNQSCKPKDFLSR